MASGQRWTGTDTARQKRVVEDLIRMIDPNEVPLISYLGLNGEKKFRLMNWPGIKYEWLEDTLSPREDTLGAAVADTSTTSVTVSNGDYFTPGMVVLVDSEHMYVNAVSGNTLTVTRGFWGSTAATHSNGAKVEIVTMARKEGADSDPAYTTTVTNPYNYTQIFQKEIVVSRSWQRQSKYGPDDDYAYQVAKAMGGGNGLGGRGKAGELPIYLERAAIRGIRSSGSGDPKTRTMGGLVQFVTKNVTDAGAGDLTQKMLEDAVQNCWKEGGQPDLILCGGTAKRKITSFYVSYHRTTRDETRGGIRIEELDTDFGTLRILLDRWVPDDEIYVIDSNLVGFLTFDPFFEEKLAKDGDYMKGQVVGEYGFAVANPGAHARIKNLSITL